MACYWSAHAWGRADSAEHCGLPWPRFTAENNASNINFQLPAPKLEYGFRNTECDAWDVIEETLP